MKIKCNYYNILFLLLVFIIMMAGTYIRFILLFHSPSFFSDEVSLLLNIQEKTFLELFLPLDHSQCCPPLFLIFAKIIYFYGGLNEFFLRVIPFTASILSIFLFAYLSFLVLKNKIFVLFSSIVFSISLPLLLYSWVFKQYSFDVLITILILIITIKLKDKKLSYSQIITLSLFVSSAPAIIKSTLLLVLGI